MRPARALLLLLPAVLLAPVTGTMSTATAAESTVLTISDRPDRAIYHDEIGPPTADVVRHTGQLTTAGGEPVPAATVTLLGRLAGSETWVEIDDEKTNTEGRYVFESYAAGNADYQVRYVGDEITYTSTESVIEPLKVMRDFNAVLVEKPQRAILKGNINPGWNNKLVQWQHKKCSTCSWRIIAKAKSGDKGGWRFEGRYPPVGKKWFYRATLAGTEQFTKSVSATLITTTTPADRLAARTTMR